MKKPSEELWLAPFSNQLWLEEGTQMELGVHPSITQLLGWAYKCIKELSRKDNIDGMGNKFPERYFCTEECWGDKIIGIHSTESMTIKLTIRCKSKW